jgi:predicted transcriptional regulator YdeE
MIGKTILGGKFAKFTAKGNLNQGIVFSEWSKIWSMELDRKYTADFELYGEKAQNRENAEVDIFIALR